MLALGFLVFSLLSSSEATAQCNPITRTDWSVTPAGWTDNVGGSPTYSSDCVGGDNRGRLDNSGEFYTVQLCSGLTELSYKLTDNSFSGGTFKVQESTDNTNWTDVRVLNDAELVGTCTQFNDQLTAGVTYVRFFYDTKVNGNVAIDDVNIEALKASFPVTRTNWDAFTSGWTDTGTGTYATTFACSGSNMARLDDTGDNFVVSFDGTPDQLSYVLRSGSFSGGSMKVQESADATTWSDVATYTSLPVDCTPYSHTLTATSRYVRFLYENKVAGNVGLDDVKITESCTASLRTDWTTTPAGWTDNVGSSPTYSSDCIGGDGMGKLDNTGEFFQLEVCSGLTELSYSLRGFSYSINSVFKVQSSTDGSTWSDIASYSNLSGCESHSYSLATGTAFVRFYYESKDGGNVGLDGVRLDPSPPTPTAVTNAASAITANTATFNGSVNDQGGATAVLFRYGTSSGVYTQSITAAESPVASGAGNTAVSADITGLSQATTYYYIVEATNSGGTVTGGEQTFTTGTTATANPIATTNPATSVTDDSAILNATVDDNDATTSITFRYGTASGIYTNTVTADQSPLGAGSGSTAITHTLTGLSQGQQYFYIVEATNSEGTVTGTEQTFTTYCLFEDFNTAPGVVPTGWTLSGVGSYSSDASSGIAPNSLKFDGTGDFIETPTISATTSLSFWIKGNSTDAASALLFEGWNGSAWATIDNITNIGGAEVKTYNSGLAVYTKFRFTYTKSAGNLAFDDFFTNCPSCTPPSIGASGVSFSNVTANSMDISFSSGNGDGRLLVMKELSAITASPVSGNAYVASAAFGAGADLGDDSYVVYRGTGNSVSVTGLLPGRTYHASIFEYSSLEDCYQVVPAASNNISTSCQEPTIQVLSGAVTPSSTALSINWTKGNGSHTLVMFNKDGVFTDPADGASFTGNNTYGGTGTQAVYTGTGNVVTVEGLDLNTTYYYQIFTYNECGGVPDYFLTNAVSSSASTNNSNIPAGYYNGIAGLYCDELKMELKNIIDEHIDKSYADVWTAFFTTDDRQNDAGTATIVWDMYSDNPDGAEPFEMQLGDDQNGSPTRGAFYYDREHTFPKSWWGGSGESDTMYTDIHHLVPAYWRVNQQMKSNYPFGVVNPADVNTNVSDNGTLGGNNIYDPAYTEKVIEPIDEYKGDLARITLYMATRYHHLIGDWETITLPGDGVMDGTSYPSFEPWYLRLMMEWHKADPVSSKEIERNDAVYAIQGNRNPYVDFPELVDRVWGCVLYPNFDEGPIASTPPTEVPPTNTVEYTANYQETDLNGWTHYWDNSVTPNRLLLSVKLNGNYIGHIGDGSFTVKVQGTAGVKDLSSASYVVNPNGFYAMGRVWDVNPTYQPRTPVQVRFYYEDADYNAVKGVSGAEVSAHTDMVFYKISGTKSNGESYSITDIDPAGGHANVQAASYSELTWTYNTYGTGQHYAEFEASSFSGGGGGAGLGGGGALADPGPLPVNWVSFEAEALEDAIQLNWETATEQHTSHFEIERSLNGVDFEKVGEVMAAGHSQELLSYQFIDMEPIEGQGYYRLKQLDDSGLYSYTEVKGVFYRGRKMELFALHPTLASEVIVASSSATQQRGARQVRGSIHLRIYNAMGNLVVDKIRLPQGQSLRINIAKLPAGQYFLIGTDGQQLLKKRFVKR